MEVIDVLGDDVHVEILLQGGKDAMRLVGFRNRNILPSTIIEFQHHGRVPQERLWCGDILNIIPLPEAITVAKCFQPAFSAYPRPGKYNKFFQPFFILDI
jgi:hypothetical protein